MAIEEDVAVAGPQGNSSAVVDRTGTADPAAATVPAAEIEARFWRTVDRIRDRNADKDPDEEFAFITLVVEEVRQERHEREQQTEGDG